MRSTPADIKANEQRYINLSCEYMTDEYVAEITAALKVNTRGVSVDFSLCELTDSQFDKIVEALIERPAKLNELNLDHNDLTPACFLVMSKLIESKKVSTILHYDNSDLNQSEETISALRSLATSHKVALICQNKLHRDYPDFFSEQKKRLDLLKLSEEKEQSPVKNHLKNLGH